RQHHGRESGRTRSSALHLGSSLKLHTRHVRAGIERSLADALCSDATEQGACTSARAAQSTSIFPRSLRGRSCRRGILSRVAQVKAAVFLDKDGTLIENVPFNADPDRVRLTLGAAEGLLRLQRAGYPLVLVSNQQGIAHG